MEKDARYYYGKGIDYIEKNDLASAVDSLLHSLSMSEHFKTCLVLGQTMDKLGRTDESYSYFRRAYELAPNNDKTVVEFAKASIRKGDRETAKNVLTEGLKRNPSYGPGAKLLEELKGNM